MRNDNLKNVRNIDLLVRLRDATLAGERCLMANHIDAHGHFHTCKELEQEILSRMNQPESVKLEVKQ